VDHIGALGAFLAFGVGTGVLAVVGLVIMFRRRGWMGRGWGTRRPSAPAFIPNEPGYPPRRTRVTREG
jgi:hypothetical protein